MEGDRNGKEEERRGGEGRKGSMSVHFLPLPPNFLIPGVAPVRRGGLHATISLHLSPLILDFTFSIVLVLHSRPVNCFRLILSYEGHRIVLQSTGVDYEEFKASFNG